MLKLSVKRVKIEHQNGPKMVRNWSNQGVIKHDSERSQKVLLAAARSKIYKSASPQKCSFSL